MSVILEVLKNKKKAGFDTPPRIPNLDTWALNNNHRILLGVF